MNGWRRHSSHGRTFVGRLTDGALEDGARRGGHHGGAHHAQLQAAAMCVDRRGGDEMILNGPNHSIGLDSLGVRDLGAAQLVVPLGVERLEDGELHDRIGWMDE
jgi:hypothetical protein